MSTPQLWAFFNRHAVDRWAGSQKRAKELLLKEASLECLLSEPELLGSCELLLQPPGSLVVIAPVSKAVQLLHSNSTGGCP